MGGRKGEEGMLATALPSVPDPAALTGLTVVPSRVQYMIAPGVSQSRVTDWVPLYAPAGRDRVTTGVLSVLSCEPAIDWGTPTPVCCIWIARDSPLLADPSK